MCVCVSQVAGLLDQSSAYICVCASLVAGLLGGSSAYICVCGSQVAGLLAYPAPWRMGLAGPVAVA